VSPVTSTLRARPRFPAPDCHAASAATAWGEARSAIEVIDTIVSGWIGLYSFVTRTVPSKPRRLNVIADIDASVWIDAELDHSEPDAWFALNKGYSLALCTVQDYSRRLAAIEGELRQRTDADTRRAHDARHRSHRQRLIAH